MGSTSGLRLPGLPGLATLVDRQDRLRGWLARLLRLFHDPAAAAPEESSIEQLILGAGRRYTWEEMVAASGLSPRLAIRLWRAFGFVEPQPDEVAFTDADRDALRRLAETESDGLAPAELQVVTARPIGRAMAALADWQVDTVRQLLPAAGAGPDTDEAYDTAARLLALLDETQDYVWRRHLTMAASRVVGAHAGRARTMAVGFADMVGFTRTTREVPAGQLLIMIDQFQEVADELVAAHGGRIIKTIGDEVLFVADTARAAAEIALGLMEQRAVQSLLPELRIGLACGPVLTHFGDVFGEPVNIAARLTAHAPPGRVLVDAELAGALTGDTGFQLRPRRPVKVRGYDYLDCCRLTRATS